MMRKLLLAALASSLLAVAPVAAQADTYASGSAAQDFSGGPAGWSNTTSFSGLCLQTLACPAASNEWHAGGADGNGYIDTRFSTFVATQSGSATGVWESPAFTYNGNGGKEPASLKFDMNTLRDVQAFLDLSVLNTTETGVDLVDQAGGTKINVVPAAFVGPNTSWSAIPSASVSPDLLTMGHSYKIRITTTYHAAATAVAMGEVGYDNVRLSATGVAAGAKGGIPDIRQLRKIAKTYILPRSAEVRGHLLVMHLRCPAAATPRPCKLQLAGLQAGKFSKSATARKIVKLRAGKARTVKIRIKPKYVAAYARTTKIWTKTIVRVGKVRVVVRVRMKL
jgi:hypothetical protein